jgi:hypothetical protein
MITRLVGKSRTIHKGRGQDRTFTLEASSDPSKPLVQLLFCFAFCSGDASEKDRIYRGFAD